MAFRYVIAIAAVVIAIAFLVAFGGAVLYKTAANAKRLMHNEVKTEESLFGGNGSVRYVLFESSDARHYVLPPVVQTQVGRWCLHAFKYKLFNVPVLYIRNKYYISYNNHQFS